MYNILISVQFVLGTGIALVLSVIGWFSSENHEKAKVVFFASTAVSSLLFIFAGMLSSREQNKANTMFNTKAVIVAINGSETYVTQDKFHTPMACAAILFSYPVQDSRWQPVSGRLCQCQNSRYDPCYLSPVGVFS